MWSREHLKSCVVWAVTSQFTIAYILFIQKPHSVRPNVICLPLIETSHSERQRHVSERANSWFECGYEQELKATYHKIWIVLCLWYYRRQITSLSMKCAIIHEITGQLRAKATRCLVKKKQIISTKAMFHSCVTHGPQTIPNTKHLAMHCRKKK